MEGVKAGKEKDRDIVKEKMWGESPKLLSEKMMI